MPTDYNNLLINREIGRNINWVIKIDKLNKKKPYRMFKRKLVIVKTELR